MYQVSLRCLKCVKFGTTNLEAKAARGVSEGCDCFESHAKAARGVGEGCDCFECHAKAARRVGEGCDSFEYHARGTPNQQ